MSYTHETVACLHQLPCDGFTRFFSKAPATTPLNQPIKTVQSVTTVTVPADTFTSRSARTHNMAASIIPWYNTKCPRSSRKRFNTETFVRDDGFKSIKRKLWRCKKSCKIWRIRQTSNTFFHLQSGMCPIHLCDQHTCIKYRATYFILLQYFTQKMALRSSYSFATHCHVRLCSRHRHGHKYHCYSRLSVTSTRTQTQHGDDRRAAAQKRHTGTSPNSMENRLDRLWVGKTNVSVSFWSERGSVLFTFYVGPNQVICVCFECVSNDKKLKQSWNNLYICFY